MEYQNIALSLPKSILVKVKHIAVEKGTSVSQLPVKSMEDMVNRTTLYEEVEVINPFLQTITYH